MWTDGLTSLDRYKGRCYDLELISGEDTQYIAYIAYPMDLFEEGSVTNILTSIVGNVFARSLAAKGIYPAVDVLDSTSTMLQPWIVGEEHYD